MKAFYKKYGVWAIALSLLFWAILTPYPFQKGGLDKAIYYFFIFAFLFFLTGLITLLFDSFTNIERLILTIIISILSVFIVTTLIIRHIENLFSGDYTKYFWETKDRILINLGFYGLNLIFSLSFCLLYISIKIKKGADK